MSSKKEQVPMPIPDQEIRERQNRALLRFATNVQPTFYADRETKFHLYHSDFTTSKKEDFTGTKEC
jgi:hypothetical protein